MLQLLLKDLIAAFVSAIGVLFENIIDMLSFSYNSPGQGVYGFEEILSVSGSLSAIRNLILVIAAIIILTVIYVEAVGNIMTPLTGNEHEHPLRVFIRVVIATILIAMARPFGERLLGVMAGLFQDIKNAYPAAESFRFTQDITVFSFTFWKNYGSGFLGLIALGTLFFETTMALIQYVERYVLLFFYIEIAPVAAACFASKDMQDNAKDWFLGFIGQALTILLSYWAFMIYRHLLSSMNDTGENANLIFLKLIVCIVLVSLVKNTEKILGMFNIHTMPNINTARAFGSSLASSVHTAFHAVTHATRGLSNVVKGGMANLEGRQENSLNRNLGRYNPIENSRGNNPSRASGMGIPRVKDRDGNAVTSASQWRKLQQRNDNLGAPFKAVQSQYRSMGQAMSIQTSAASVKKNADGRCSIAISKPLSPEAFKSSMDRMGITRQSGLRTQVKDGYYAQSSAASNAVSSMNRIGTRSPDGRYYGYQPNSVTQDALASLQRAGIRPAQGGHTVMGFDPEDKNSRSSYVFEGFKENADGSLSPHTFAVYDATDGDMKTGSIQCGLVYNGNQYDLGGGLKACEVRPETSEGKYTDEAQLLVSIMKHPENSAYADASSEGNRNPEDDYDLFFESAESYEDAGKEKEKR